MKYKVGDLVWLDKGKIIENCKEEYAEVLDQIISLLNRIDYPVRIKEAYLMMQRNVYELQYDTKEIETLGEELEVLGFYEDELYVINKQEKLE